MEGATLVKAGDTLSFDSLGRQGLRLTSKTGSIKLQINDETGEVKHVAAKTGLLMTQNIPSQGSGQKSKTNRDKVEIDIVPIASNRYLPQENDVVLGVIVQKSPEFYLVDINAETYGFLGGQEFQNATKRDKPNYPEGTLLFCRVLKTEKYAKPILTCISLIHKKAWNSGEAFFGQLQGGLVKDFSIGFCRRILSDQGQGILEKIGQKIQYEINIGYNGKIWIKGARTIDTIFIFNALERIVESGDIFNEENLNFILDKLTSSQ